MKIEFSKYHGTGNDFILIDDRKKKFPADDKLIRHMCDRRFGIGSDGLILLSNSDVYDFCMTYFNSDGKPGSMCGNGGRCAVAFAQNLNIISEHAEFLTSDGMHIAQVLNNNMEVSDVKLKMQDVHFIKMDGDAYIINTGSPHYTTFVSGIHQIDVVNDGRLIRNNEKYKTDGVNVNFVEVFDDHLYVRTYERGVENETLSCGTGVTASALAYALKEKKDGIIKIQTQGGNLVVMFTYKNDSFSNIWLEGPAAFVFKGKFEI